MESTAVPGGDQSILAIATAKRAETLSATPGTESAEPALAVDEVDEADAPLGEPEREPAAAVLAFEAPETVVIFDGAALDAPDAPAVAGAVVAAGADAWADADADADTDAGAGAPDAAAPANCTANVVAYWFVYCEMAGQCSHMYTGERGRRTVVVSSPLKLSTHVAVPSAPMVHSSWPVCPSWDMYHATALGPTTYVAGSRSARRKHGGLVAGTHPCTRGRHRRRSR
jgi:hypothetical protein